MQQNYLLDTKRKKLLYTLGLIIAILYAVFCGLSLAGYVVLTFGTGGGALLGAVVGALVCSAANFKTSITKIPEILVDFFGRKRFFDGFFQNDKESEYDKYYWRTKPWYLRFSHALKRRRKKIFLALGIILSCIAGLAIFGQGYGGITAALMAFAGITAATSAITGIGIFGAAIFFVAFWAITLKAIILELQKKGWFSQFKQFFKDLFDTGGNCKKPTPQHHHGRGWRRWWRDVTHTCDGAHKSKLRTYLEGGVLVMLLAIATPLAIIGVVTAMMASHMGIMKFVSDTWPTISQTSLDLIKGFSWFFVVGLASLGQLPFYLKTTMKTVKRLGQWSLYKLSRAFHFGRRQAAFEDSPQLSFGDKLMYAVRLVNAGYSSLYSFVGGGADHSWLADTGAAGGVLNSFSAPEKIGGTGFSDIWRNFKAEPADKSGKTASGDLELGGAFRPVTVSPTLSGASMTFNLYTPLLGGDAYPQPKSYGSNNSKTGLVLP